MGGLEKHSCCSLFYHKQFVVCIANNSEIIGILSVSCYLYCGLLEDNNSNGKLDFTLQVCLKGYPSKI